MTPGWWFWLDRNRTHCKPCRAEGRSTKVGNPRKERNPVNPRTAAAYARETRAAFLRHVKAEHPAMVGRVFA